MSCFAVPRSILQQLAPLRQEDGESLEDPAAQDLEVLRREAQESHRGDLRRGASAGHQPLFMMLILGHLRQVSLGPGINGTFVDCTFGRGGHSRSLLRQISRSSTLYAMDVDQQAVDVALEMARKDQRLKVFKSSYARLAEKVKEEVQAVLINSGFTTEDKRNISRGMRKGPLDLRFDTQAGVPCWQWLANMTYPQLWKAMFKHSDIAEMLCKRISHELLYEQACLGGRFTSIAQLETAVRRVYPAIQDLTTSSRQVGPKRVLGALRRMVNREMEELQEALSQAFQVLRVGGRCLMVCQNKLEATIAINFARDHEEPRPEANLKMDVRRLRNLYPLAGTELPYAVKLLDCARLSRFELTQNPDATPGAQLLVLEKVPRTILPMPRARGKGKTSIARSGGEFLKMVVAVLDLGLHRRMDHDSSKGISSLATKWISKAAATQRKGRAGRTQPGLCLRLYTKQYFEKIMPDYEPPESTSMSLDRLYLQAKQLSQQLCGALQGEGVPRTAAELLMQMPEAPNMMKVGSARQRNAELGTISEATEAAKITALGHLCLQLPLDLKLTRLVWLGAHFGVASDAVVLASVLSSNDAFSMPSPLFMREASRAEPLPRADS
ncbi:unnamed protein product [Effrenium voratum]|uniref:Uncharacterized protein n=1 Tax=Effrenium voratum TaxID=2562239 RepID=A0AA36HMQ1_9DINO|nr:unnamed protein product [Effrenium voratum]